MPDYSDLIAESKKFIDAVRSDVKIKKESVCQHCGKEKDERAKGKQYCTECRIIINDRGYKTTKGVMVIMEDGSKRLQHDLIVEGLIGRELTKQEVVVHLDGDKLNNDPSNLELRVRFGYGIYNGTLKCDSCNSRNISYDLVTQRNLPHQ